MDAISKEKAQTVLGPFHERLARCVTEGWRKWQEHVKPTLPLPSARGRANAIHEYMVNEARELFGEAEGVRPLDAAGRFLLAFPGLVVRFKKCDDRLRTRNLRTQLSMAFDRQEQIWMDGVLDVARITVGYVLNALGTELKGIYVVLLHGSRLAWSYELLADGGALAAPVVPLFPVLPNTGASDQVTGKDDSEESAEDKDAKNGGKKE